MTQTGQDTADAFDFGPHVAYWLRAKNMSAKQVGRIIGASETTGKRLRCGVTPTAEQMAKLSHFFGWAFVQHVFQDLLGPPSKEALAADMADIKKRLAALEAHP